MATTQYDPTRTTGLRRSFVADMARRFAELRRDIWELVVTEDALGLVQRQPLTFNITTNANQPRRWAFLTSDKKLEQFQAWLAERVDARVLRAPRGTPAGTPWLAKYIESAYRKGNVRSFEEAHPKSMAKNLDFYNGTRGEFLRSSFDVPERLSKIQLLATRSYEQLKGVTAAMSGRIATVLSEGIANGENPRKLAAKLFKAVDGIGRARALTIARTEIIHAHAEGQLDAFEEMGIDTLVVMAEWMTAGDDRVCPECAALSGVVYTVKEARGLIPRHPNCRCAWAPADPGDRQRGQVWGPKAIRQRIEKSVRAERPGRTTAAAKRTSSWTGADTKPGIKRKPPRKVTAKKKPPKKR